MPYNAPIKEGDGWVLPKKEGGLHKSSSGKVVKFHSKEAAEAAARYIMSQEDKKK